MKAPYKDFNKGILAEMVNENRLIVYCFWHNWKEVDEMFESDGWKFQNSDLIDGVKELLWDKRGMEFPMCRHYFNVEGMKKQEDRLQREREQILNWRNASLVYN